MNRLPPLNALRAFWAVMRKGNFRAAAAELLVSPQAVSQQIRLLEDTLDVTLFERRGRKVEPTERAILLSHFVQAGFDEFTEGIQRVTNSAHRHRININVSPYFATRYLVERLERFRDRHSGADLRLTTMIELPDFTSDEVDVAIQWGFGQWTDFETTLLISDPKIICCSSELAKQIKVPEDLTRHRLLHPILAQELWARVLRHLGLEPHDAASEIQFQDAATMRRGTISGIGVGLISRIDAEEDLKAGTLVAPLGTDALIDMDVADIPGFYLILPRAHRRIGIVASFSDWITSENWNDFPQPR